MLVYLFACMFVYLFICFSFCLFVCLSVCLDTLGIKIDLKEKPMTDGFSIGDVPEYAEPQYIILSPF
jgi:hypothetical protein